MRCFDNNVIRRPSQSLLHYGIGLMTELFKITSELCWNILVQLEFHLIGKGTSRSSCASSAA